MGSDNVYYNEFKTSRNVLTHKKKRFVFPTFS